MKLTVKYFASIRECVGRSSEALDTGASTLAQLRDELVARNGVYAQGLARGKAVRVALNQVMSEESAPLCEGCEVAFFPPVTGG